MKKTWTLAIVILTFYGCKKADINKVAPIHTAADSIYLVSSINYAETSDTSVEKYFYNNKNQLSKYITLYNDTNSVTSTYTYNADGTLSTIFNGSNTLNITYTNGLPATDYVSGAPSQTDMYTIAANHVARIIYYEPVTANQTYYRSYYTYDLNNNLTGNTYINSSYGFADSIIITYSYNTHKSAFYYFKNNLIIGNDNFLSLPLGGGNDLASSTLLGYFNGTFDINSTITSTSTYNSLDMPVETKSFKNGTQIETINYTYVEKEK
jgi:hypothetical protein